VPSSDERAGGGADRGEGAGASGVGPSRIRWELERAGVVPLPGRSAVYRALVRHGLVAARRRRRRREDYRRWERPRAMDLWQMDVMGRVFLADGSEVKIVTGIDDHSRFAVCARAVLRATARPVCQALTEALRRHGIPAQILTDNGKVFTGRFGRGRGLVLFDRICRDNGIKHLLTKPYSPTTTGKAARPAGRCGPSSCGPRTASTRRWPSCRRPWMRG
jgi:transposase InsO family protein